MGEPRDHGDERAQKHAESNDDHVDPSLPAGVDLLHGNGNIQAISIAEGKSDRRFFHALITVARYRVLAHDALRDLRERFHRGHIHVRMINEIPFFVVHEGISVFIQRDVVHQLRHEGILQLNADDADEPAV